jgi:hypothetical protein
MPKFLTEARLGRALIGMLHAIPTTPLYERLEKAGRLNDEDASNRYGTNVVPLGMSREELRDGFIDVIQRAYTAEAYFERIDALFIDDRFKFTLHQLPYWRHHRWAWAKRVVGNYVKFFVVVLRLLRLVEDKRLRSKYRQQLLRVVRTRVLEPHILFIYAVKVAMHYHYAAITRALACADDGSDALHDAVRSFSRMQPLAEAPAMAS